MKPIRAILIALVQCYRWLLSPALMFVFGPAAGCRYTPSCSVYAQEALRSQGAARGSWLAVKRVCRCHPWGGCGHDPVPMHGRKGNCGEPRTSNLEHPTSNGRFAGAPVKFCLRWLYEKTWRVNGDTAFTRNLPS